MYNTRVNWGNWGHSDTVVFPIGDSLVFTILWGLPCSNVSILWKPVICFTQWFKFPQSTLPFFSMRLYNTMIFIEQFRARWPWSIGILKSWLSVSSSSDVPAYSILRMPSPRRFHPRLWETSSGVVAVGVLTAEVRRELRACPSRLHHIPGACVLLLRDWPALGQLKPDWFSFYITALCD